MCDKRNGNIDKTNIAYRIYSQCEKRDDALQQLTDFPKKYSFFAIRNNSKNRTYITVSETLSFHEATSEYDNDTQLKYHHDLDDDQSFQISSIVHLP